MLATTKLTTILPVTDMERARRFYGGALGLEDKGTTGDGKALFRCADGTIALIQASDPAPNGHTAASFEVDDIGRAVSSLMERGVVFEDYDFPDLKTVNKVCVLGSEKAAWFKDPDGHILCIHEEI